MNQKPFLEKLARFQSLVALVLMVVALSLASSNFLTLDNTINVLRQISINVCLSLGMTLVILSGGIDLSVGSVLALSGAVAAGLLMNGLAFVATLGMLSIARGLTMLWTGGFPVTGLGDTFGRLGTGHVLRIPTPVWISALLVILFIGVTRRTRFGRHLYAVGGNERAAILSGLAVPRIKLMVYTLGGALAAVAGLLVTARLDSATPNAGLGYELDSIAAVVIGGTSLSGGRGSIFGTVLGCLIIGVLNDGLFLLNVSPFWQQVIKGVVILAAVAMDKMGSRKD